MIPLPNVPSALAEHLTHIDHIALAVPDVEAALVWYERLLGFRLVERRTTRGARTAMISAVLKAGPVTLVLTQGTTPESQVSKFVEVYGPGVSHVALGVRKLQPVIEALREQGIEFATSLIESPGLKQIFTTRDRHSGMMIEIIQRDGGTFTDESVENLFRQLESNGHF